jgi:hypothetical protein
MLDPDDQRNLDESASRTRRSWDAGAPSNSKLNVAIHLGNTDPRWKRLYFLVIDADDTTPLAADQTVGVLSRFSRSGRRGASRRPETTTLALRSRDPKNTVLNGSDM